MTKKAIIPLSVCFLLVNTKLKVQRSVGRKKENSKSHLLNRYLFCKDLLPKDEDLSLKTKARNKYSTLKGYQKVFRMGLILL